MAKLIHAYFPLLKLKKLLIEKFGDTTMEHTQHHLAVKRTLLIICTCGLAGVLVDIDHPLSYLFGLSGRFLHTPLLIGSLIVLCCLGACFVGLLVKAVLIKARFNRR